MRLHYQGAGDQRAGDQPVAHIRIEMVGAFAQAVMMQRGAFRGGDYISRGPCPRRLWNVDLPRDAYGLPNLVERRQRFRRGSGAE